MCGIIGYIGNREAAPILLSGLSRLEYRGYDSAGIAVADEKVGISVVKSVGKVRALYEKCEGGGLLSGKCGIAHTRWATHGAPSEVNAHPHISRGGLYAIVHNGIIENAASLRDELSRYGYHSVSETDSEVVAHLLEYYDRGDGLSAVFSVLSRLEGSYALGILRRGSGEVFLARHRSPLLIGIAEGETFFASDVTALLPYTARVIGLEDGECARLTAEKITVFDRSGRAVCKREERLTLTSRQTERGGYSHYMRKEIAEEGEAVDRTVRGCLHGGCLIWEKNRELCERLSVASQVVIVACGSAYYAGHCAAYAMRTLLGIPITVELAGEFHQGPLLIDKKTVCLAISQSGETADTLMAVREAKRRGAFTVAIVNCENSTLAKESDYALYTLASPEIAVATTKGFTSQLAALYLFTLFVGKIRGVVARDRVAGLLTSLRDAENFISAALSLDLDIQRLAERYHGRNAFFYIGRQFEYSLALEGALKLREIAYRHAYGFAAGELKHGSIALIEGREVVLALACHSPTRDRMLSTIAEVKARGADVIAIVKHEDRHLFDKADAVIGLPYFEELFFPLGEVIPLQLFAYHTARLLGCDIDMPRNLAKSVTVE
ncbi:MAG: glutamine--fructose-6-phosphate transaminase (isomerizing) [Clostridia bacterium]|nr:glutamine--fructose-6-phosphate transaminase (isomerizing) [Clostridia bacterium]